MFVIKFFFRLYIKLRKKLNSSSKVTDWNPAKQTDFFLKLNRIHVRKMLY